VLSVIFVIRILRVFGLKVLSGQGLLTYVIVYFRIIL